MSHGQESIKEDGGGGASLKKCLTVPPCTMGRLSMPQKRKRDDFFTVDRVWERKEEEDGTYRYLTSWKGFAEKTWEPIEHFTDEAIELVKDLERILDHPEEYGPKPQWLLDFEDQKARGVNVLKRTPGYNAKPSSSSRSASSDPQSKLEKREDSLEGRRTGRQRGDGINYSDIARRRSTRAMSGQREESATPSRTMGRRVTELATSDRTPNGTPPPRSHQSSRASTRPAESDRAESEDEAMVTSRQEVLEGQKEVKVEDEPSSSSTIAADDAAVVKTSSRTLKVDVPIEMRVPLVISPPALASPNNLPAASPASTVLSASKIDSATGILLPLEPAEFPPFDWVGHIEKHGGEAAPLECFWKRRIDRFVNPFGDHIGKLLKVPDYDEVFTWEWCTVGTVIAVHGPWVQIHALDTDPVLAHWYMADDAGIQPFVTLSDQSNPKCKEPNKRRSTGNYKRMVERSMFDADGTDKRVPRECFEDQIPWKNRPVKNHFKVGYKLETYDPVRGEGCFYPATVVEVNAVRELVKFHFDGYPESHTKIVSYNDYRLFPCGFAASIGWKCILPEGLLKKNENRGRKKVSVTSSAVAPISPVVASPPSIRPSTSVQPPNNNNEKHQHHHQQNHHRKNEHGRARPSYREESTPDEDDEDEEEEEVDQRFMSRTQAHRTRAPAIPGLMKRSEEASPTKKLEDKKKIEENVAEKRKEDTIPEKKKNEEPPAKKMARQKSPVITRPARQLSPLTIDDFTDEPIDDEAALPLTAYRYVHTGNQALIFLNHECNVGLNIHPSCFRLVPSKIRGSLPHVWREILQQLANCSVDGEQFINCIPKLRSGQTGYMSVTYDETSNSTVGHFIMPPPNMHVARLQLAIIMKKAGLCPNAISFDARRICEDCKKREPADSKIYEILRNAKQQQQQSHLQQPAHRMRHEHQAQQPPPQPHQIRQPLPGQQQHAQAQQMRQQQQQQAAHQLYQQHQHQQSQQQLKLQMKAQAKQQQLMQQQQQLQLLQQQQLQQRQLHQSHSQQREREQLREQQQQQRVVRPAQMTIPPAIPRVSSTSNSASHRQLPSTMHHTNVPLPAVPPTSRPVPAPAPPVNVDDLDRFLTQKVNLKTLTENEILEMLQAIGIPEPIRVIFKQKKINWRALLGLTEDIMVEQLNIPRQWATTIDKYLEKNKSD